MTELLILLFICCGSTILLEALPGLFVADRETWWKASVICNVITNPLLNTLLLLLISMSMESIVEVTLFVLEVVVVFVEAFFYQKMLHKKYLPCFAYSLIANALSFSVGVFFSNLVF